MTAAPTGTGETLDDDDVAFAGVAGQAALLREGRITSVELVDRLLRRIERWQPALNAFRIVLAGDARRDAAAADEARRAGDRRPLLGVPIAVKDNVPVAGQSALFGTGSPEPAATDDDELVRRLRAAGLVVVGLTHLPELALWAATESSHHGVTRNPWRPDLAPGGSSGGSAAAVAAGLVPAAHATDGLGSIRIPASSCGLVGLKPTHGLVPLGPDPDHWRGLSHAGFLTRSVRDTALLLDAATSAQPSLADAEEPTPLRVAYSLKPLTPVKVDPRVRAVFDATLSQLRDLGHATALRDPPIGPALSNASTVRYLAGVADDVDRLADPRATEPRTRTIARLGRMLPEATVGWARRKGDELRTRMSETVFTDHDVLLTPTMPVLPVPAGSITGRGLLATLRVMVPRAAFTAAWNNAGLPAISLPVGQTPDGMPVGMQLVGPAGSERTLLGLAAALERLCDWTARRPALR